MIVAHCGSAGHRGHAALVASIRRLFYMDHLDERASEFLRGCLLCPHVKGGKVVHRPYAPTWHGKERNEGIHFDYLFMSEAYGGAKYVLVSTVRVLEFLTWGAYRYTSTHFCDRNRQR